MTEPTARSLERADRIVSIVAEQGNCDRITDLIALALDRERLEADIEIERLRGLVADAYQVVGALAHYTDTFDHPDVIRALDNFSRGIEEPAPHSDLLPWPKEEIRPAVMGDGWRNIATAPKDGSLVLAYLPESAVQNIVFARWSTEDGEACWYEDRGDSAFPIDVEVSHWLPLPDPPTGPEPATEAQPG